MPALEKAKIWELGTGDNPQPVGDAVDVQFNPSSLKVQLSNRIEGGRQRGRQVRQFVGSDSNAFTLDLVFDTADEGTTDAPVSVLERTEIIEKYIKPKTENNNTQENVPKMRFEWGDIIIDGIVESVDIEFDYFAENGSPLRANVTLRIKEQNIEFQLRETDGTTAGGGNQEQTAQSLADELPSEFAARNGLDPADWRGLDLDLGLDIGLGLSLEAGIDIGFSAGISASLGVQLGIEAGINASLEASLGLEAGVTTRTASHLNASGADAVAISSGVALSSAGGVSAALDTIKDNSINNALTNTVDAFNLSASARESISSSASSASTSITGTSAVTALPPTTATGTGATASSTAGSVAVVSIGQASRASSRKRVDARASSYGFGVPLRSKIQPSANVRTAMLSGATTGMTQQLSTYKRTSNKSVPGWVLPPKLDDGLMVANKAQKKVRPVNRCGCHQSCLGKEK